jgi:hypothetical protein
MLGMSCAWDVLQHTIMITPALLLNSKVEQVAHTTFSQRCRPKTKRE